MHKKSSSRNPPVIRRLLKITMSSQWIIALLLILMCSWLTLQSPYFFTWYNIRNILDHSSLNAILAVGMTFVICSGGIDLSIGSIAGLSGVLMALAMKSGVFWQGAMIIGLMAGLFCGAFNGLVIAGLKVNPFIVTLGTMSIFRGLSLILTGGIPIYGFPVEFTWWGSGHIGPVNPPILMAVVLIALGSLLLNHTRLGYNTLAIGGNEEALRRTGVNTFLYKILAYSGCGLTAFGGGLVVTARLNTADPLAGVMFELEAIAAVILGGTSLHGGRGTILGTWMACLLLGVLRNGLVILNIPSYYQQILIGCIILSAVIISEIKPQP